MKSKASYFSLSLPLIIENTKRMWAMPVIGFLVYFFSGAFPIIMSYKNLNGMASYIEWSLHNLQPFYMAVHLILPVVAAVILFGYLQNTGSVAVMHSMPFTRSKLYNSNYLSGLILISLPILLNGIILLLLSKPTFNQWGPPEDRVISAVNVFTKMEVLNWIGVSLLIVAVLYSIAVFTGIVTGNSIMHFLSSYYFIFLIPLLYVVFNVYFEEFLFGFDISGSWIERALSISPFTGVLQAGGHFSLWEVIFYLFTIVAMTLAGAFLYGRRKLERAGDSLTFEFVKPIISYVVAFLGMTMLGFYFYLMGQERIFMYAGFVAGTLIFFIIGTMVVEKSPRIYNRQGYKNFVIYAVIAILFVVGLRFDLTGFENRVPKVDKIQWAEFYPPFDNFSYSGKYIQEGNLKDPKNIEALMAFHKSIVDDKERLKNDTQDLKTSPFNIKYKGKSAFAISRQYKVDYLTYKDSPQLKTIFESKEYKEARSFFNPSVEKYVQVFVYSEDYRITEQGEEGNVMLTDAKEIVDFIALLEKDFQAMTFEELVSLKPVVASVELQFIYGKAANRNWVANETGYQHFGIPATFTNTVSWLKEHGYVEKLTADLVEYVDIYPYRTTGYDYKSISGLGGASYGDGAATTITDPEKIQMILDRYETEAIDYNKAYEVHIYLKDDQGYAHGYLNGNLDFLK